MPRWKWKPFHSTVQPVLPNHLNQPAKVVFIELGPLMRLQCFKLPTKSLSRTKWDITPSVWWRWVLYLFISFDFWIGVNCVLADKRKRQEGWEDLKLRLDFESYFFFNSFHFLFYLQFKLQNPWLRLVYIIPSPYLSYLLSHSLSKFFFLLSNLSNTALLLCNYKMLIML